MKFVPAIVSVVAGAPAPPLDGDSDVSVGTGLLFADWIVNCWFALPPPGAGFATVTTTSPAFASNEAGIITVSEVEVCDSTPTAVTPKLTVDAGMNPVPV